jgi:hypothetical protein
MPTASDYESVDCPWLYIIERLVGSDLKPCQNVREVRKSATERVR